ncbi:GNAT family N-acetyltransferase [Ramlibacter sp. MAHUQ-53]|uniref:GNAT family N-acetyltransferase n=1 Tax=unclassified Ramlibacter TaxID=2617605 RepID=UPI003635F16C
MKARVVTPVDQPVIWMDNERWWLYGVHPQFAAPFARFHARNRHHLRMAMSLAPELEQAAHWEGELARRRQAMSAGQAVHLVGFTKEGDAREIGCLASFWAIEHGDFQACTISFLVDEPLEGSGLMYAAIAPAVREVLARYKLHRIMATHLPENLRSARLLRRLGFTVEGYARDFVKVNGEWRDNVLLSLVTD